MHAPPASSPSWEGLLERLPDDLVAAWSMSHAGLTGQALGRLGLLAADAGGPEVRALTDAVVVDCRLARGDLGAAMAAADRLEEHLAPRTGRTDADLLVGAVAHHALAELAAALGELARAARHYDRAGRLLADAGPASGIETGVVPWRAGAALTALRQGDRRHATALARAHVQHVEPAGPVRGGGSPYARAGALRTLAAVEVGVDRVALLRRARARLDALPAGRLGAQIDADLAGLLLLLPGGAGHEEAVRLLRAAEEHAGRQELWPLQGRVRRLLERLGLAPRRFEAEAVAVLTAAERRVAGLAASGLTNRQVAEELVVTVKAVEWHLSRVYRKLGLASRAQLAAILGAGQAPAPAPTAGPA